MTTPHDLAAIAAYARNADELKALPVRTLYEFTFPESVRANTSDPKSVSIAELSPGLRLSALQAARGNTPQAADELAKLSVAEVNGSPVEQGVAIESLWPSWSPKVRELVVGAYSKVNMPTKEDEKSFFGSMALKRA